jgi:hypothetical protein
MDERTDALAATQHGVISRSQAMDAGLSRKAIEHRLRRDRWVRRARGVYRIAGAPETPEQSAMTAVLSAGPRAVLSHASAAALADLPGFSLEPFTVSVPRVVHHVLDGVRIEQSLCLPEHHTRVVRSIPCTSAARTIFDLCGDLRIRPSRAARALDTALARRIVTMPDLWRVLDDLAERGRRGTVWMRTLLTERGGAYVPPESELEARFVSLVHRYGLPVPDRQVDLGDRAEWIGRVDFVWRDVRVIAEVDGAAFHDGLLDRRRDAERDRRLASLGWTVLRFRWDDVVNTPAAVAHSIRFALYPSQGVQDEPKRAS